MKCPTCGRIVAGLACEACTAKRSLEAIRAAQAFYLGGVLEGRLHFFAMRESIRHHWHLALFGDRTHALCGEEVLRPGSNNRRFVRYPETQGEKAGDLCEKCLDQLRALEEAHAIQEES